MAACGPTVRQLGKEIPTNLVLPKGFEDVSLALPGVLALKGGKWTTQENATIEIQELINTLTPQKLDHYPLVIICDDAPFLGEHINNFVWVTFTRANPSHDIYGVESFTEHKHWGCRGPLIIDARIKPHHAPGLVQDPEITKRADRFFAKGGSLYGKI